MSLILKFSLLHISRKLSYLVSPWALDGLVPFEVWKEAALFCGFWISVASWDGTVER